MNPNAEKHAALAAAVLDLAPIAQPAAQSDHSSLVKARWAWEKPLALFDCSPDATSIATSALLSGDIFHLPYSSHPARDAAGSLLVDRDAPSI
jgi:hypothetical protein